MDARLKASIWHQFGAAIDTLDLAITACPDEHWGATLWKDEDEPRYGQYWYIAYHTLVWLDLFLSADYKGFLPPAPFIRGALPETRYSKEVVSAYLKANRQKCKATIEALTDEKAFQVCNFPWMTLTYLELQLYSLRHVQEHAAQLLFYHGQHELPGPDWIAQAKKEVA